jgi:hypothetical protein
MENKPKRGRPRQFSGEELSNIKEQVRRMSERGCTNEDISLYIGCSHDTLTRRFAGVIKKGRAVLRLALREAQIKVAIKQNNPTMLIWLGKQLLDQKNDPPSNSLDDQLDEILKNQRRQYEMDLARAGKTVRNNSGDGDDT